MASNPSLQNHPGLDEWIEIGADGRVLIRTGKVDIGQRISTALAMIAAEELDVDLERVDIVRTETDIDPDEGITSGSNSMEQSGNAVRAATATARRHMMGLAAAELGVEAATLEIDDGLIQSRDTNRSVTYWDLQGGEPFGIDVDAGAEIKAPEHRTIIGTAGTPRGMADLVAGRYTFLHDIKRPGMLHARVVRPPHYGAVLKAIPADLTDRLTARGIEIVRDGSFLAVACADEYAAIRAAEQAANAVTWDVGTGLKEQDIYESLTANERISLPVVDGSPVDAPVPDLGAPPADAAATVEARYEKPYLMHGSIGPSAGLAVMEDGKLRIWSHSQGIYFLRESIADCFEMDLHDVQIVHAPGAGCYGHNGADDAAFDAALIARALPGKPVLLKWTREEEHAWEPYGTCMAMKMRGSVDADGKVVGWSQESYGDTFNMRPRTGPNKIGPARLLSSRFLAEPPPTFIAPPAMGRHIGIHRNLDPLYDFPDRRLVKNLVRGLPLRTSALRTLGAHANVFAIECFMDELAETAEIDPLDFRLQHLSDPRAAETLETVGRTMSAWPETDGRGRGIAFAQYKNIQAYATVGVELEVTDAADVMLHRMVIAGDAGEVVDRAGLIAQMEGGAIQAASWTLYEEVTFDRDGITSIDWETYPILRFDNVPEIETILLDRPGMPFMGAGEASSGPAAAAIGNAIYAATGLRLRRAPFTPDAIRAAAMAA